MDLTKRKMTNQRKNETLVDEAFYVWETRYGLWNTETKEGRGMMTGATRDAVVVMTRWHLKCEQEELLNNTQEL